MKKTRPNSPAYPCENPNSPFDNNLNGLTKREYFATSRPCIEKSAYDEVVKELHDLKAKMSAPVCDLMEYMRELEAKVAKYEDDNTDKGA